MGFAAWMVLLGSVAVVFLCLALLVRSGLLLYRSVQSAWKDYRAWSQTLLSFGETLSGKMRGLREKAESVAAAGEEISEKIEDIRDAWEELRSHPLLRAVRFAARFRR